MPVAVEGIARKCSAEGQVKQMAFPWALFRVLLTDEEVKCSSSRGSSRRRWGGGRVRPRADSLLKRSN